MKRNQVPAVKQTRLTKLLEPTEAEIQKEAYNLWFENGRPEGRDLEIWHAATEILRHRHAAGWARLPAGACVSHSSN